MHAPPDRGCTMDTASTALQSCAPARAAPGSVESGGGITHLEQRRSHARGLRAQCSPGAQSGGALPARPEHTQCTMSGQRWSAALPLLGRCTLCFHTAFPRCACRDMSHYVPCCIFKHTGGSRRQGQHARSCYVHEAGTLSSCFCCSGYLCLSAVLPKPMPVYSFLIG